MIAEKRKLFFSFLSTKWAHFQCCNTLAAVCCCSHSARHAPKQSFKALSLLCSGTFQQFRSIAHLAMLPIAFTYLWRL